MNHGGGDQYADQATDWTAENGSWHMALLAAFMIPKAKKLALPDYLGKLIAKSIGQQVKPSTKTVSASRRTSSATTRASQSKLLPSRR